MELNDEYREIVKTIERNENGSALLLSAAIIDETKDLVCAYKADIDFAEDYIDSTLGTLKEIIIYVQENAPEVPVILKIKNVKHINYGYELILNYVFEHPGVNAIIAHPYFRKEALQPFLDQKDKGVIVPYSAHDHGSGAFYEIPVVTKWGPNGSTIFSSHLASKVFRDWNENNNCGVAVDYGWEAQSARKITKNAPIFISNIRFDRDIESADIKAIMKAGGSNQMELIVNRPLRTILISSRSSLAETVRFETLKLRYMINQYLW